MEEGCIPVQVKGKGSLRHQSHMTVINRVLPWADFLIGLRGGLPPHRLGWHPYAPPLPLYAWSTSVTQTPKKSLPTIQPFQRGYEAGFVPAAPARFLLRAAALGEAVPLPQSGCPGLPRAWGPDAGSTVERRGGGGLVTP